jgi:hypothetical protein
MTPAHIKFVKDARKIAPGAQVMTYTYLDSLSTAIQVEWWNGQEYVCVGEVVTPQTVMFWGYDNEKPLYDRLLGKIKQQNLEDVNFVTD